MTQYKHHLFNDRWAIEEIYHGKRNGFFIEAGATNGINGSGTFVLEKEYGWDGICVEANDSQFKKILEKRKCKADNRALYSRGGMTLDFTLLRRRSGRSGLTDYLRQDTRTLARKPEADSITVPKETVSLFDLLEQHHAPTVIEYFCLDVEGSELPILEAFPFDKPYKILAFSVEGHRCTDLLKRNGYVEVKNPYSSQTFEAYYVHREIDEYR